MISSDIHFSAFAVSHLILVMAPFISLRLCWIGLPTSIVKTEARDSILAARFSENVFKILTLSARASSDQRFCAFFNKWNLALSVSAVSAFNSVMISSVAGLIIFMHEHLSYA